MQTSLCRNAAVIGAILPLFIVSTALGQPNADSGMRDPHLEGVIATPFEQARSRAEQCDVKAENALGVMYSREKEYGKTMGKLFAGTAKPQTEATQKDNTILAVCITTARACHRIVPRQSVGTRRQPIRVMRMPNGHWA